MYELTETNKQLQSRRYIGILVELEAQNMPNPSKAYILWEISLKYFVSIAK
jgi:hypothetical protein